MATLTQQNITSAITLIYGGQASTPTPIQIINLDTVNTVFIGNDTTITANGTNVMPLEPLASLSFDGSVSVYGVCSAGQKVTVGVVPGGSNYSPGTLNISGPVTISGVVTITGTPTFDIAAGSQVAIAGTPTFDVATGASIEINNASIDTNSTGVGGFVLPGQLDLLLNNTASLVAGPLDSVSRGPFNVSNFSSVLFSGNNTETSSTSAGAAVCAIWEFQWSDTAGNLISVDLFSQILPSSITVQVPVKGASLTVTLINIGSTGNVTGPVGGVLLWGDYRELDDIRVMNYNIGATSPVVNGTVVLTQGGGPPASGISGQVLGIPGWICSFESNQNPGTSPSETFLIPLPVWRGPVSGQYSQSTVALAADATIVDLTFATQGNVVAGSAYEFGQISNLLGAIGSSVNLSYNSPPTQLAFIFKTGATLGNTTIFLTGLNS